MRGNWEDIILYALQLLYSSVLLPPSTYADPTFVLSSRAHLLTCLETRVTEKARNEHHSLLPISSAKSRPRLHRQQTCTYGKERQVRWHTGYKVGFTNIFQCLFYPLHIIRPFTLIRYSYDRSRRMCVRIK